MVEAIVHERIAILMQVLHRRQYIFFEISFCFLWSRTIVAFRSESCILGIDAQGFAVYLQRQRTPKKHHWDDTPAKYCRPEPYDFLPDKSHITCTT